jgi:hypothetical protein
LIPNARGVYAADRHCGVDSLDHAEPRWRKFMKHAVDRGELGGMSIKKTPQRCDLFHTHASGMDADSP